MGTARIRWQLFALGVFLLGVAVSLGMGAARFPGDKGYTVVGPHVFPLAVAAFLGVLSVLLCWQAANGGMRQPDDATPTPNRTQWTGAAWVSAGILGNALLIDRLGFVLSAALLFATAARGFGSRQPLRDLAVGMALTLPVFWLFTQALGLSLPALLPNKWI
jgi:putative tricarboxylic transport membrane protein